MRAGACGVQQTLTAEAASVLKHSLSLARRRGHAQVTPLHVAFSLLSSRASILKRACLQAQPRQATSHPIHCRALEVCFNVSLNRLPTIPGPLMHGQPSLSNALVAALKRAQACQRRGCIEQQQQQPLITVKVELEHLIISILDDPSVSRAMREAGFSSIAVKNKVEDSSSSPHVLHSFGSSAGVFSSPSSPPETHHRDMIINNTCPTFWPTHFLSCSSEQNPVLFSPQSKKISRRVSYITNSLSSASIKEDVKLVLEVMLRKKRNNTVIVDDSVSLTEGLVLELMGRIERGDVPDELKSAQLIKFQFASVALRFMKREHVEMNLSDLKRKVDFLASGGRGAIIYAGDLEWTVEACFGGKVIGGFNPVEYIVAEIGKLVADYSNNNSSLDRKVWLMATASYQTYMKCQMRQPSLEILWDLQAVPVPSGGVGLSLHHSTSFPDSRMIFSENTAELLDTKTFAGKDQENKVKTTCCGECISNFEKEAQLLRSGEPKHLPSWLKPQDAEARRKEEFTELRRKWNRLCHSLHQGRQTHQPNNSSLSKKLNYFSRSFSYSSSSLWLSDQSSIFPDSSSFSFADLTVENNQKHYRSQAPSLDTLKRTEDEGDKLTLALGNSGFSDSRKPVEQKGDNSMKDRGLTGRILRENVPWQSEAIPSILEALMDTKPSKKETWLLIEGTDTIGKRRLAHAIAQSLYGSTDMLFHMNMKSRDDETSPCSELLAKSLRTHEKLVVLVEEVDKASTKFKRFLAERFETRDGKLGQAVFILTEGKCNSNSSEERMKSQVSVIQMVLRINESCPSMVVTQAFDIKRKAEWELPVKTKSPRTEGKEDASWAADHGTSRTEFLTQSSFSTLDLNIKADEYDIEVGYRPWEVSPMSSDLTRETNSADMRSSQDFLESIKNTFIFSRNATRDREMKDFFISKIKKSFEEIYRSSSVVNFDVDERVIEEVCIGSGFFLNSLFEKWLHDVFQTSMQTLKLGGRDGISIRLCLDMQCEKTLEDGFMGSILPKSIQVCSVE